MATEKEYQALIDSLSGECERLHKENNELKVQINDVLDKISKDIKKAIDDCDSVYYTSALHKALEIIDNYTK